MDLNDFLSPEMKVKPLKEGETARFRLLNAHVKEKGRDEPSCPERWALPKECNVQDLFAGTTITLQSVESVRMKNDPQTGRAFEVPVLKAIIFEKGEKVIQASEHNFYVFMMRNNGNISNSFRKKGSRRTFELVSANKKLEDDTRVEDNRYFAEKLVRDSDITGLKIIIKKLNSSVDSRLHVKTLDNEFDKMKLLLIQMTKWNPKAIILASGDIVAKVKVVVQDAEQFNLIAFEPQTRSWFVYPLDPKRREQVLENVAPEALPIDTLIEYFKTSEGQKTYVSLAARLQQILKATA